MPGSAPPYGTTALKRDLAAMLAGVAHVSATPTPNDFNGLVDALRSVAVTPGTGGAADFSDPTNSGLVAALAF